MSEDPQPTDTLLPAALAGLAALAVSILVGLAHTPIRNAVGLENVAIIYMVIVAVAAVAGGTVGGLMAAVGAALSYTFFFTTPYLTLRIDSIEQVGTVVLLFIAGTLISFAANATRGRLVARDAPALPAPSTDDGAAELINAVVRAKANGDRADWVAVRGLQRLYDAQWVALIPSEDVSDREVIAAGDPPASGVAGAVHSPASNGRVRRTHRPAVGAMAHVYIDQQHPAALVVMPRLRRPPTDRMQATVLAVAHALEAP